MKTRDLIALLSKEDPDMDVAVVYAPDDVRYLPVTGIKVTHDTKIPTLYIDWNVEDDAVPCHEPLEDVIYEEQRDLIEAKHGVEAAEKANYGWGVDCDEVSISISTKVYNFRNPQEAPDVITSSALFSDRKITHDWKD